MMKYEAGALSKREFAEVARDFGYRYRSLSSVPSSAGTETGLFRGSLGLQSLPCGISLCASDLTSMRESEHDGVVSRSLTIAVSLDGVAADCELSAGKKLFLGPGSAAVVTVEDQTRLASRVHAGQRSKGLLVRVKPEDLADDDVAERVEAMLGSTSVTPLPLSPRTSLLVNELFAPTSVGGIGRLLAESCALELLARSLLTASDKVGRELRKLSLRDQVKILRVRDRLIAAPEREYSLAGLARDAGLSISALKVKFPLVFGVPVFSFLRDLRMQRAREGLEREGWTVSQAAYFVGYRHHSNFSTAFRRKFGIAPSDVRRL